MPHPTRQHIAVADSDGAFGDTADASSSYNPFILKDLLRTTWSDLKNAPDTSELHDLRIPPLQYLDLPSHHAYDDLPTLLQLPQLETLPRNLFDKPVHNIDESVSSLSVEEHEKISFEQQDSGFGEDIWTIAGQLEPLNNDTRLLSWEAFTTSRHQEIKPLYISEAGTAAFDALLQLQARSSEGVLSAGTVVKSNALLQSLWHLALGRPSTLFRRVEGSFRHAITDQRLSGYSLEACQSLFTYVNGIGTNLVHLNEFRGQIHNLFDPLPSLVALSNVVDVVVSAVEQYLVQRPNDIISLLQLQALVAPAEIVVDATRQLISATRDAHSEIEVLVRAFETCQNLQDHGCHNPFLFAVLERVSGPWLGTMTTYLRARSFRLPTESDYLPFLISADNVFLADNIHRCSLFLQSSHSSNDYEAVDPTIPLKLAFTYADLERINAKVRHLQHGHPLVLANAHHERSNIDHTEACQDRTISASDVFRWGPDLEESISRMTTLQSHPASEQGDNIYDIVTSMLSDKLEHQTMLYPPISLVPTLSLRPVLMARSTMLTSRCLQSLLVEHRLLYHLRLLQQFYLCGSGIFTAQLRTALFSPEVEAAERTKGILRTGARTMGLKVGSGERREWPPASSELTLALMGVLNEGWRCFDLFPTQANNGLAPNPLSKSFASTSEDDSITLLNSGRDGALPGNLSFAIRTNLSEEEVEKTLNPRSIFALDFLCLSYSPSEALSKVITPSCLERYDRIFKQLLRMLRMQFVIEELYRDIAIARKPHPAFKHQQGLLVHSFRYHATHVVTALASYFHQCISKEISKFHEYVSLLNEKLAQSDGATKVENPANTPITLSTLAEMHERCLSEILACLFQRKRQHRTAALLEELFNCILQFSTLVKNQHDLHRDKASDAASLNLLFTNLNSTLKDFQISVSEMCVKMEHSEHSARRAVAAHHTGGAASNLASDGVSTLSSLRELLAILDLHN